MSFSAACSKLPLIALAIATSSLGACATGGSKPGAELCPPVVEYSRALQERAAQEVDALPEGPVPAGILSDYAVMRKQARTCSRV